jgi:hypothetical protein
MSAYIRAQSAGEIFRNAAHLYRENFRALFLVYVLPLAPLAASFGYYVSGSGSCALLAVAYALLVVGSVLAIVPITVVLSDVCLGNRPDLGRAFRLLSQRSAGRLVGTCLLSVALCGLGAMLLLVPGLILIVHYAFVVPVAVLERISGWQALRRSRELGKGFFWRVCGIVFLSYAVVFVVSWLIGGVLVVVRMMVRLSLSLPVVGMIANLLALPLAPLPAIVLVLLYYDLRVRKEAYDSAALAEDLRR